MSLENSNVVKPYFLKNKFDVDFSLLAIFCTSVLATMLILPYVTKGYDINRLFPLTLVILSIFFVIGCIKISNLFKLKSYILILMILIPYFLSQTSFTYEILGQKHSYFLDSKGEIYNEGNVINDQDSTSSKWIAEFTNPKEVIYANAYELDIFSSQGSISSEQIDPWLFYKFDQNSLSDGIVFMRYLTVPNRNMTVYDYNSGSRYRLNVASYPMKFDNSYDKIYLNGDSGLWKWKI